MKIVATKRAYPGFEYEPDTLTKYIEASGLFSILLKGGKIVHYKPSNPEDFRK